MSSDLLALPEATAESLLGVRLPDCPAGGHSAAVLEDLARSLALRPGAWQLLAPHVAFDARQYRRVRLWRDLHWEGLLLNWLPGQCTAVHDHGGSTGMSLTLAGTLVETRFRRAGEGRPLDRTGEADASVGRFTIEYLDTIHEVANRSAEPAISLHVYSPPLSVLGAWDPADGRRWAVPVSDRPAVVVGGDPALGA